MNLKQCVSAAMAAAMTLSVTATPAMAAVDESPGISTQATVNGTVTFFAAVDDEWKQLDKWSLTRDKVSFGSKDRNYVLASELQEVYSDYGFSAASYNGEHIFPHTDDEDRTVIWADTDAIGTGVDAKVPVSNRFNSYMYYCPNNTPGNDAYFDSSAVVDGKELLNANMFYSVSFEDPYGLYDENLEETRYLAKGDSIDIQLPLTDDMAFAIKDKKTGETVDANTIETGDSQTFHIENVSNPLVITVDAGVAHFGEQSKAEEAPLSAAVLAEKSHQDTKVYASAYGSYTLTVPESINLHNLEKNDLGSGLYVNNEHCKVNLRGDVRENQVVVVTVTEPVMQSKGSADVDATVDTSSKTIWSRDDMFAGAVDNGDGSYSDPTGTTTVYPVSAELTPGDWTGTAMFNCSLETTESIASLVMGLDSNSFDYDGNAHGPKFVFAEGANLVEGKDYVISGNVSETDEGNYTITITGSGKYTGSTTFDWRIKRYGLGSDMTASLDKTNFVADGLEHSPNIVWGTESDLKEGTDFEISGTRSATDPGNYTITITGKGKYKGTLTLDWSITATDISNIIEGLDTSAFEEDGTTHSPKIVWKDGYSLVKSTDYDVSGTTSSAVGGNYTITITGKGKYTGTITLDWKIAAKPDIALAITGLTPTCFDYDEAEHAPEFVFAEGYENLVEGVDYTVTGTRIAIECDVYKITVTGIGKYKGAATFDWKILELIPLGGKFHAEITQTQSYDYVGDGKTVYFPLSLYRYSKSYTSYTYEDEYYYYCYDFDDNSWWINCTHQQNSPTPVATRSYICGKPVTRINFQNCRLMKEAPAIPNTVTSVSRGFRFCTSLTKSPVIPNGVTDMEFTFYGCSSLTEAPVIPDSMKYMEGAFYGCRSLVTYAGSTDSDGDFSNYVIPSGVRSLTLTPYPYNVSYGAFEGCTSLTKAPAIPNSVTSMESVFKNCTSLTEAPIIPDNVTNMTDIFNGCTSLTGTLICNANPTSYENALKGTKITSIEGTCSEETKAALLATR